MPSTMRLRRSLFIQLNKSQLRTECRVRRRELPAEIRQQAARQAREYLIKSPIFERSQTIACYLATGSELNTQGMIEAIWAAGKKCYLPVLTSEQSLEFIGCDKTTELALNKFKIYEPVDQTNKIPISQLDLVLLPLVAFDAKGRRIGAGGGFYDRTFGSIKKKPMLIGLAFSAQEADEVPVDEWDVGLDGVLTEKGLLLMS